MPSFRRLLPVAAAIAAITLTASPAAASSHKSFYLDKTCAADASEPLGYVCTVAHSDFRWIPAGTEVHYLSQTGNVVDASISIKNGRATGACTWSSDVDAICRFHAGIGRLAQFNLEAVVSASADGSIWYWNGTYWFGN
jgi:hypothetical protein